MSRKLMREIEKRKQKIDVKRAKAEAVDTAIILLMSLPVKVLHDQFGWGEKRLGRFSEALTDAYQDFADGDMELEDLQRLVWEQCGIKFQKTEDKDGRTNEM